MAKYADELLDHEYDGIQEMDNSLPRWWLYGFYFSIIFSILYFAYYHVFHIGYLQADEYRLEKDPNYVRASAADARILGVLPEYHPPQFQLGGDITPRMIALAGPRTKRVLMTRETDTTTYVAATDPALIKSGGETFQANCAQCHGKLGEGGVGPNLTDDYWLHGAEISDIVRSAKYGYPSKGMVAWQGTLSEDEIINVASYVMSLRGTDPPNARKPQGELVSD